jgi:alpha-L-fucosidase
VSLPDQAYCDKFYNRTADLIKKYHPDLIYFDDDALPLWPVSDAGLKIAADFYNSNMKQHNGKLEACSRQNAQRRRAPVHRLGHRARRGQPDRAAAVGDGHLHRQLALRPLAL